MACVPCIGGVPTGSSSTASEAKWFMTRGTSNVTNPANASSITASICSGVRSGAGAASTRVRFDATKNMSAITSAVIFCNRLWFLIHFSFTYEFIRGEHRVPSKPMTRWSAKLLLYGEVAEPFTVLLRRKIFRLTQGRMKVMVSE